MITLKRTDATDKDFIELVRQLDAYLTGTDGDEHGFYDQYNKLDAIKYVVLAYDHTRALGCGAIKAFSDDAMEVKRMFVHPDGRQQGIATMVLKELENWARELGYQRTILETGKRQTEAVLLYENRGYRVIPNYGQYIGVINSICFEKTL